MAKISGKLALAALMVGVLLSMHTTTYADNDNNNTAPNLSVSQNVSQNWAGYVADTSTYSAVGGSWHVPTPSSAVSSFATDATWVGIGGVTSDDLIQAGTQALVQNGSAQYQAWYEMLPGSQHVIPLAIAGGDSVSVSLTEISSGVWYLSFTDNTTGKSYNRALSYQSSRSSAEWVEEMPVLQTGRRMAYAPLDNFGTVTFSGGYTMANGTRQSIAAAEAQSLTMAGSRGTETLAEPSSLLADDSFSVSRASGTAAQQELTTNYTSSNQYSITRHHSRGGGSYVVITFGN